MFKFNRVNFHEPWTISLGLSTTLNQTPEKIWSLDIRSLIEYMTSGDCMALVLGRYICDNFTIKPDFQLNQPRPDGIDHWRRLIGPTRFYWKFNTSSSDQGIYGLGHVYYNSLNFVCFRFKGFWSKEDSSKKYSRTVWRSCWWLKVLL